MNDILIQKNEGEPDFVLEAKSCWIEVGDVVLYISNEWTKEQNLPTQILRIEAFPNIGEHDDLVEPSRSMIVRSREGTIV